MSQYTPAPFSAIPHGLEAEYLYNGLLLNARSTSPDRYRITEIDGLSDADIRDSREDNPLQHGEIALDSFYNGRTITINGRIEAGNIAKLREMQESLRSAFGRLVESPLYIKYYDIEENFLEPESIENYETDYSNGGTIEWQEGCFYINGLSDTRLYRKNNGRPYSDVNQILEFSVGSSYTWPGSQNIGASLIAKRLDASNYIEAGVQNTMIGSFLYITAIVDNVQNILLLYPYTLSALTKYWLEFDLTRNTSYVSLWGQNPGDDDIPLATSSANLTGVLAEKFGNTVFGGLGLHILPADGGWSFESHIIRSNYPSDAYLMCKKSAPILMREAQSNAFLVREFQITMRASNPRFKSTFLNGGPNRATSSLKPNSSNTPGRIYPRTFMYYYKVQLDNANFPAGLASIITLDNKGNFPAQPIFRLYGYLKNPVITNNTNGQSIKIDGEISSGSFLEINIEKQTITNNIGINRFSSFNTSSDWILLEPGENDINLSVDDYDGNGNVTAQWEHCWM